MSTKLFPSLKREHFVVVVVWNKKTTYWPNKAKSFLQFKLKNDIDLYNTKRALFSILAPYV